MNGLLYGYNSDERIVAVHQKDDRTMRIYFREGDNLRFEDAEFYPFFFLEGEQYLEDFRKKHWMKKLDGDSFYQYLCVFEEWSAVWDAIRHVLDHHNRTALEKVESYQDLDGLHFIADPLSQYLMQTGRTLFKGMAPEDLYRLQVDIETYAAPPYKFSNAQRPGDRIILIALSDNRGWSHLINGKKLTEEKMLSELVRIIREKDPDVIEGHNIYSFDLPYILKRCELHNVQFLIGRDGSAPRSFDTRTTFAERSFEYPATNIAGRHIVDTLLLVQSYDMTKRNMESYGLKYAARYFGLASPDRTYIAGEKISWHWDNDIEPLMKYALEDVTETRMLSEQLSGTPFYLTQMLPMAYSQVIRTGSAAKIESLLVREYLRQKHSIPKPSEGSQTTGGYTDIFAVGVFGPVIHVDVESLYPSIMITHRIAPETDVKRIFLELLKILTALRLDTKRRMKASKEPTETSRLDAAQSSLKILINSFYGYLGYTRGLFNDFSQADVVTMTGQEILRKMITEIRAEGGKVIEVDTDGIFFVPPPGVTTETDEERFVGSLATRMPRGITLSLDGRYKRIFSYKKKNYALLGYDGRIQIKGSSLISRSMEPFGRRYIQRCIDFLLTNDTEGLHRLYTSLHDAISCHKLEVRDFARTETLKDSLAEYLQNVDAGKRNRSAAYEAAISLGRPFRRGERISYYITGNEANPRGFENCKPRELWDPNFPDENIPYYLKRLDEFSEKFKDFFLAKDYRAIFSTDDLFPFSSHGISPLSRDTIERERLEETDSLPTEPTIWLDEE